MFPRRTPLPDRLAAKAFALAVDPALSPEAAGAVLGAMASGRPEALRQARDRVESRLVDRPTRLAEDAALALRAAARAADPAAGRRAPAL